MKLLDYFLIVDKDVFGQYDSVVGCGSSANGDQSNPDIQRVCVVKQVSFSDRQLAETAHAKGHTR